MDNQHKLIKGYRDLSADEIARMNRVKELAETVRLEVEAVQALPGVDQRWAAIGKTDLQTGFMALIRSIAQPTTF